MRKTFHEELKGLREDISSMGETVVTNVEDGLKALIEGDVDLAQQVIEADDEVDRMNNAIEEQCISIMARQSPVARDLRMILSTMFIAVHLERMGDLALNVAKTARRTVRNEQKGPEELTELLDRMGKLTLDVVRASLEAYAKKDVELAARLPEMDDPIDDMHKEFLKALVRYQDEESLEWATSMVLAGRFVERIADHAVDIGERVAYLVTGELREFNVVDG
jgi:phosphate transport system protein